MELSLSRLRVLPRWIIFLIDLACVFFSVAVGFLLRFNFNLSGIASYPWMEILLCVAAVNIACFSIFRTFAGIIRHTGIQDAWKVLTTLSCSTVIFIFVNLIRAFNGKPNLMPYTVILIAFFSAFAIMFFYRLLVKVIFDMVIYSRGITRLNVVIYGSGYVGSITRNVLQSGNKKDVYAKVVAFIDDDPYSWGTQLEGLQIHRANPLTLNKLLQKYKFSQLVITDALQNSPNKEAVVEWCLENKVKVQQVPPMVQWMQSGLKLKQIRDIRIEDLLNRKVITMDNDAISRELTDKVILVTGAAGSIGSELSRQIASFSPSRLVLCDQAESPLHDLLLELKDNFPQVKITPFLGDICNRSRMDYLFDRYHPQIVFHAAAYKHVPVMEGIPDVAVLNNVMGTLNIAELSVMHQVIKFVMISTDKAVNPTNVMGASKRIAEILTQSLNDHLNHSGITNGNNNDHINGFAGSNSSVKVQFNEQTDTPHTAFITTRFGNVLGSNGSVVPWFKKLIEKGGPITVTDPEMTRYFMTISEACQLVLQAGVMGTGGEIFAFDMGTPVKIADLAVKMIRLSGLEPGKDIEVIYTGLRPGEKLYEEVLAKKEDIIPTYHEKIMIARVRTYDYIEVNKEIQALIAIAQKGDVWKVVQMMKQIVPEYKSKNSVFEKLDNMASAGLA